MQKAHRGCLCWLYTQRINALLPKLKGLSVSNFCPLKTTLHPIKAAGALAILIYWMKNKGCLRQWR